VSRHATQPVEKLSLSHSYAIELVCDLSNLLILVSKLLILFSDLLILFSDLLILFSDLLILFSDLLILFFKSLILFLNPLCLFLKSLLKLLLKLLTLLLKLLKLLLLLLQQLVNGQEVRCLLEFRCYFFCEVMYELLEVTNIQLGTEVGGWGRERFNVGCRDVGCRGSHRG
jgi:hypothetical protein